MRTFQAIALGVLGVVNLAPFALAGPLMDIGARGILIDVDSIRFGEDDTVGALIYFSGGGSVFHKYYCNPTDQNNGFVFSGPSLNSTHRRDVVIPGTNGELIEQVLCVIQTRVSVTNSMDFEAFRESVYFTEDAVESLIDPAVASSGNGRPQQLPTMGTEDTCSWWPTNVECAGS